MQKYNLMMTLQRVTCAMLPLRLMNWYIDATAIAPSLVDWRCAAVLDRPPKLEQTPPFEDMLDH
jgi:hypothetical protein